MQETAREFSPGAVSAGILIVSAFPLAAVEMFPELKFVIAPAPYLLFHNIAEFFSIMVSLSMFGMGWYTYDQSKNRHALFLSSAFLGIGLMDFMHTLANAAMPPFITPNSSNKSTQFWIAVRLFQAVAFLISAYVYSERPSRWLSKKVLMTSTLIVSFLVFTGITFFPAYLPATFVPGAGLTPFKKTSEYLVIGLLCAAALAYWRRMTKTGDRLLIYYEAAFIICIFSELPLAAYTKVFDTYNVLGHIYKVAAFYLIYQGIYRASVKAPYQRLTEVGERLKGEIVERKQTEEALRQTHNNLELRVKERTAELAQSNAQLRTEVEDRRKAEEASREAHDRALWLARFPDENPNPLLRVSADGTVLYCNLSAVDLHGWTCAVGRPLDYRLLPMVRRAMAEGEEGCQDVEIGRGFYFVWVAPFPKEGYANVYGSDITERKQMEEELRRSRDELELRVRERTVELERRNRELQEFAFVASHDLSEPLRKIQTFGSLLEAKSADRLDEQSRDYVSRMTGAANRMQELLDALLRYSRLDTKGQELRPAKLDDVVRDSLSDLEVAVRNIEASVEIGPLPIISGDPHQLRQLFQNLIANALKYHRSEVKTIIKIHGEENNGAFRIYVQDNGIGFEERYLDKIFQPFQRLHGRNEYPGTGIGLAICRKIVDRHGGTITARSTPGKGSTFVITLPLKQGEE